MGEQREREHLVLVTVFVSGHAKRLHRLFGSFIAPSRRAGKRMNTFKKLTAVCWPGIFGPP